MFHDFCSRYLVLGAVGSLVFCLALRAADPPGRGDKKHAVKAAAAAPAKPAAKPGPGWHDLRTGEDAIEEALDSHLDLEFVETPLCDVVDFLKDKEKIEVHLSKRALDEAGVQPDTPVTCSLHNIRLASGLNLILDNLGLTWTIGDNVLLITSPDHASRHLSTKVYDVADLIVCRDKNGALWNDFDSLKDVITSTVEPKMWDDVGGTCNITAFEGPGAKTLIVSATYQMHGEIAVLLCDLRKVAGKSNSKEPPLRDTVTPGRAFSGTGGGFGRGPVSAPPSKPAAPAG